MGVYRAVTILMPLDGFFFSKAWVEQVVIRTPASGEFIVVYVVCGE